MGGQPSTEKEWTKDERFARAVMDGDPEDAIYWLREGASAKELVKNSLGTKYLLQYPEVVDMVFSLDDQMEEGPNLLTQLLIPDSNAPRNLLDYPPASFEYPIMNGEDLQMAREKLKLHSPEIQAQIGALLDQFEQQRNFSPIDTLLYAAQHRWFNQLLRSYYAPTEVPNPADWAELQVPILSVPVRRNSPVYGGRCREQDEEELCEPVSARSYSRIRIPLEELPLDTQDEQGYTLLHYAAAAGLFDLVQGLVSLGARTDILTDNYLSVLHLAAISKDLPTVKFLADRDDLTLLSTGDSNGLTPLHWAIVQHTLPIVTLLAPASVINQGDGIGDTPLHYAIRERQAPIILFLLLQGADPDQANLNGITPRTLAQEYPDLAPLFARPPRRPSFRPTMARQSRRQV